MSKSTPVPKAADLKPRITVIGIGGAGGNAVNNMIAAGLPGVNFIVANTDAQALLASKAETRIQLGVNLTEGLGAGSKPEIGEAAAREAEEDLKTRLVGTHMLFLAAGMGGGTGTGATAVIARIAKDLGILTVAVVTKPFSFEGTKRMRAADSGIAELRHHVDTLIVIPNQNLFRIANEKTTFSEAFLMADQVLYSGIACIVDLIVKDGLINLDLADVRTVLTGMGPAVMGTGEAVGERRAVLAAEEAIANQLLDTMSLTGAKGLLLSIIGGPDMTLYEVDEAASRVRAEVDPDANIIVGAAFDDSMKDRVRVSIVASGMPSMSEAARTPANVPPSTNASPQPRAAMPAPAVAMPPPLAAPYTPAAPQSSPPPLPPRATPPPLPPSAMAGGYDRSSDGIRIQDAASIERAFTPEHVPSTGVKDPLGLPPRDSDYAPPGQFTAKPVTEPRRPQGRVPDLSEFPVVGQKEYQEKSARYQVDGNTSLGSRASAPEQAPIEPKKGRLFQRLAEVALGRPRPPVSAPVAADKDALPDFFARDKRA